MNPVSEITPARAAALLEADMNNVRARVAAGDTLTASQRALVASIAEGGGLRSLVRSKSQLATELGVSRVTVNEWLRQGAPRAASGLWDARAWRSWAQANGKRLNGEAPANPEKAEQERRRLVLQSEKLEAELAELHCTFIRTDEARQLLAEMAAEAKRVVHATLLGNLPHELVGMTVPEAERRLRAAVDSALEQLHTGHAAQAA